MVIDWRLVIYFFECHRLPDSETQHAALEELQHSLRSSFDCHLFVMCTLPPSVMWWERCCAVAYVVSEANQAPAAVYSPSCCHMKMLQHRSKCGMIIPTPMPSWELWEASEAFGYFVGLQACTTCNVSRSICKICLLSAGSGHLKHAPFLVHVPCLLCSGVAITMTHPLFASPPLNGLYPEMLFAQNLPSVVACHVLSPQPGETVLDMCAAPGQSVLVAVCS